jgi:hypothetical protein
MLIFSTVIGKKLQSLNIGKRDFIAILLFDECAYPRRRLKSIREAEEADTHILPEYDSDHHSV